MRYTTIIDLTEFPALYRSESCRLVYLHLVLKSGYHDSDRDLCDISLRRLATDTGLTLAAVRCALARLANAHMIAKQGTLWYVRKFVLEQPITPRAKTAKQAKRIEAMAVQEQEHEQRVQRLQIEEQKRLNLMNQGKTSLMVWYEQQLERAAAGDKEAADYCERNRLIYEAHQHQMAHDQAQQQPTHL